MKRDLPCNPALTCLGSLALLAIALSAGGDAWRDVLRYQRDAVLSGQIWRLLSAHLVHAGWRHLALNLIGLSLIGLLFRVSFSARQWLGVMLASVLVIDAGFVWLEPGLDWYVGLSGLLHGLMAAGAVAWWRGERGSLALVVSALLAGKLIWEQFVGPVPTGAGIATIVDAHLYGAIGGLLAGLWIVFRAEVGSQDPTR